MASFVDETGRSLEDYPRPSLAVDTALLTVHPENGLCVLVVKRPEPRLWALPGTFLHPGERLADAVRRSLRDKAGVTGLEPQQLRVLDDPERDDRGWVLSVAHLETIRFPALVTALERADVRLAPAARLPRLAFDHRDVVRLAIARLREQYLEHPDPRRFLPEPFTLAALQQIHEAVSGQALQKDTFRRLMEPRLRDTGGTTVGQVGRPARLFRHLVAR